MKLVKVLLFLSLLFILGACGGGSTISSGDHNGDEPIKLLVNNTTPSTHHIAINGFDKWAELVEEETDGRIIVEVTHGGALGSSLSVYEDVKNGLYDISFLSTDYAYDTRAFPWSISDLPFVFSDGQKTHEIVSEVLEKFAVDQLNEEVKYLGLSVRDPYIVASTKPIHSIDDVKGMNIIVPSRLTAGIVEDWGASPLAVEYTESYEALERGTADAIAYSGASAGKNGMQFNEVAPYFIQNLSITTGSQALILNKAKYESIPDDLKEIFDELAPKLGELMTESYISEMKKYPEELSDDEVTFIHLTDEELSEFNQYGKNAWEEWIEMANEKGYPGEEMVDYLIELLEEDGVNLDFLQ